MNWSDERYVRLYTRKTAEWAALCWQAKALHGLLLMDSDRTGIIQVPPGPRRLRMLAGLVGLPEEVVQVGLADLLDDGRVMECEVGYLWPNYIEAQETPASPRQRTKEWRARARDLRRDETSRGVTKRLQSVTPYHAVPSSKDRRVADAAPVGRVERAPVAAVSGKRRENKKTTTTPQPPTTPEQLRCVAAWDGAIKDGGVPADHHHLDAEAYAQMDELVAYALNYGKAEWGEVEAGWIAIERTFGDLAADTSFHDKTLTTVLKRTVWQRRLRNSFSALKSEWAEAEKARRKRNFY